MTSDSQDGRTVHRIHKLLIVAFIVPALLFAFAVKSARAAIYKVQPVLCDGIDDDADAPVLFALPKETAKELFFTKPKPHLLGNCFARLRSQLSPITSRTQRTISYAGPPLPAKRLLTSSAGSANDPDAPH